MNPPRIEFRDGKLIGVRAFEHWALSNDIAWNYSFGRNPKTRRQRHRALYYLAYHKTIELERAHKRLIELELIAPKRIKCPDGKEYVYRCPDHLIPLDEPIQYR